MSPIKSKIYEVANNVYNTVSVVEKLLSDNEFSGTRQGNYLLGISRLLLSIVDKLRSLNSFYIKYYFSYDQKFIDEHKNVINTIKFVGKINDNIRAAIIRFLLYRGWSLRHQAKLFGVTGQAVLDFYRKKFKTPANSRILKKREISKLFDEQLLVQAEEMNKTFGGIILSMFADHTIPHFRLKSILQEKGFKIIRKPLSIRSERVRKIMEYVHDNHIYKGSKIAKFFGVTPQYVNNILFRYGLTKKKKVRAKWKQFST